MKALVTGGTGFVGSHLVEVLRRRGHEVTALVRTPSKAAHFPRLGVQSVGGDLEDAAAVEEGARGRDVVFHLAGVVAAASESEFLRVNRDGTRRLIEAASRCGRPRLVFVSSLAAAGPAPPGQPLRGREPARPVSAYGRSKLAAEEMVRDGPLPWTILRPPTVYGPADRALLPIFKLARRGVVPVFGSGDQELSAVYAPDLAEAMIAATAEACHGRTYYPCHPEILTSRGLALAAGRALGRKVRVVQVGTVLTRWLSLCSGAVTGVVGRRSLFNRDKARELLQAAWTADPGCLERDTGWRAGHDLESGLVATVAWYREQGWL